MKVYIKKVVAMLQSVLYRWLVQKHFADEIVFFTNASMAGMVDAQAKRSLFRSTVHQLDKKLLSDAKKEQLVQRTKLVVQDANEINGELLEWGKKVLDIAAGKPLQHESVVTGQFNSEQIKTIIRSRRSIRSFTSKQLPEGFLSEMVECALWAPTGCDRQNLVFLPVTKKEDVAYCQKCAGEPGAFVKEVPLGIVVLADCRTYAFPVHRHQAYLEAGAAIQNMLLFATSKNIGSIWLNWAASGNKNGEFQKQYKLPSYLLPLSYVVFGYVDKPCFLTPVRKSVDEAIAPPKLNH